MSWSLSVKAKDEQFASALRETINREKELSHHNPRSRTCLEAIHEFAAGAVKNLPLGSTIQVQTSGHLDGPTGYGQVRVVIELHATPVETPVAPEPASGASESADDGA